ncbi:helix-turn-helix transcriptional regulator [Brevibacterium sp. CCUG 69071]|uniref:helix-turn-helix transcriptional regulator n=1 Tax=Brevibacterium sp. CCUG 69071 TaxID=2052937 RepID=UPI001E437E9E|nr:YafY family protein [Brevibacterium sp. CCUG 69071]
MTMHSETRLLSLLGMFASGRIFSAAELAERFDVTPRTIRRDIASLREIGYVIGSVPGTEGGYRAESRTVLPPLQLESGEALSTAVGLALLRGAGLSTANADSATEKLRGMLPADMQATVRDIGTAVSVLPGHAPGIDLGAVIELASAIASRAVVTFDHRKGRVPRAEAAGAVDAPTDKAAPDRQETEGRRVEPVRLVVLGAHWYLYAWDLDRADWRSFRLDRMSAVHATTFTFAHRPHPDAEAAVSSAVTTSAYRRTVVLRAQVTVEEAKDWFPTRSATITEAADGVRIEFGVDDLRWAAVMATATPGDVEVIEPAELREELRTLGERARRVAEKG